MQGPRNADPSAVRIPSQVQTSAPSVDALAAPPLWRGHQSIGLADLRLGAADPQAACMFDVGGNKALRDPVILRSHASKQSVMFLG